MNEMTTLPEISMSVTLADHDAGQQEALTNIGQTTEVSWLAPANMTYEQWSGVGSTFQQISRSINWWIGDWLNAGEMLWGEMAMQAVEETGRGVDSLLKCKAVAMRFAHATRVDALSWSHHRAVAYLDESERDEWLGAAIAYQIATRDLNIIARFDRGQRHTLLKAANNGVSLSEFNRIFDLVRLDRETEPTRISTLSSKKVFEGEYEGQYDEEEDGLPFDERRDEPEWVESDILDIEEVFGYFERLGAPLKTVHPAEALWEGMAVHAEVDSRGFPLLVWEQIP